MDGVFYEKNQKYLKCEKIDLVVIRINCKEELVNARPCYNCLDMMKAVGIRKVYYSIHNDIICEKVSNMVSICSSSISRQIERNIYGAPENNNEYYKKLLYTKIPKFLTIQSVENFIEYNLKIVLPNFTWKVTKKTFEIYDENNQLIKVVSIYL